MRRVSVWTADKTVCLSRNPEILVEYEQGDPYEPTEELLLQLFPQAQIRNYFWSDWKNVYPNDTKTTSESETTPAPEESVKIINTDFKGNKTTGIIAFVTAEFFHPVHGKLLCMKEFITYRRTSVSLNHGTDDWDQDGGETGATWSVEDFPTDDLSQWYPDSYNRKYLQPLDRYGIANPTQLNAWRAEWKKIAGI